MAVSSFPLGFRSKTLFETLICSVIRSASLIKFEVHLYLICNEVISRYVSAGLLAGRVLVRSLDCPEWGVRFVITFSEILKRRGE